MIVKIVDATVVQAKTRVLSRNGANMQIVFQTGRGDRTINLVRNKDNVWHGDDGWVWPFPTHPGVAAKARPLAA